MRKEGNYGEQNWCFWSQQIASLQTNLWMFYGFLFDVDMSFVWIRFIKHIENRENILKQVDVENV